MDEEDFQVSGQELGLGWGWTSEWSYPISGAERTEGAAAGAWLGRGGAGEGCSEEAASPSWQAVTAAQSSSVRKRLSAAAADLLGRPKAPRSFTDQRLLSAATY